ncbi:hypothetical protein SSX86_004235 [Deinandra increscens subsp. villosa]|uniref:Uncharacterized protein n=1 Tax=Deinandra increscens subsp. villosa TaxID=3103831 RepID=A0AAP0DMM8_9ASTR
MEGKKQASSSSSFTNELFGSTESSDSSSSGLFNSIFPPVSKAHRKNYLSSEETNKNYDSATRRGSTIDSVDNEDQSWNQKKDKNQFYQQETSHPCHLSSSIYYGGQDVYINPRITKNTPGHSTSQTQNHMRLQQYNKDGEDDGRASRGNWWQGSLYY